MPKLYFINPGELDIRALVTQGVSAKADGTIGKFGTGAKYAIAGILRLGGSVCVSSAGAKYTFFREPIEIRGKEFHLVKCWTSLEGKEPVESELGFTTSLGQHWQPWQLYRELRANALDEGGEVCLEGEVAKTGLAPGTGMTIIEVDCAELALAHENLAEHWLSPVGEPIWRTDVLEVWPGRTKTLFYRGMKCGEWQSECQYTYNFTGGFALTEDRTCESMYTAKLLLGRELLKWDAADTSPIEWMLSNDHYEDSYERSELDWNWSDNGTASREFLAVVAKLRKAGKLRNDKSWVKLGRSYNSAREYFIPVASPATEAELACIHAARHALVVLGLPTGSLIAVTQDWEESDWDQDEYIDGVLYVSHHLLAKAPSFLAHKLAERWLGARKDLAWQAKQRWWFEQLLVRVGLGSMLPLPADVQQDEVSF